MRFIKLTKGKYAMVDDEDYEYLNQWKWQLSSPGYATRDQQVSWENKKQIKRKILLHRVIMDCPESKEVDHIDGNRINNQKINLRVCTHQQNAWNQTKLFKHNTSGITGVYFNKLRQRWYAQIKVNGKTISLGSSKIKEEAIKIRHRAEEVYHPL